MEPSKSTSGAESDTSPPSYASLMESQSHEHVLTPLVSPTSPYPLSMPTSYASYSVPEERKEDVIKPAPRFGYSQATYAPAFLHDPEVNVRSAMERAVYDERINVFPQRRDSLSDMKKCFIVVVVLLVCGAWAVISMNLNSRHRRSDTF